MPEAEIETLHPGARVNILMLGAPRAGKSSLLRLLQGSVIDHCSEDRAQHEVGFERYISRRRNLELAMLEGFGVEEPLAEKWDAFIYQECRVRADVPHMGEWFHVVIYCVGADMPVVDHIQLDHFIGPLLRSNHSVLFVITKADVADTTERAKHRCAIEASCPNYGGIIEVSGADKEIDRATSELLFTSVRANFAANLRKQLGARYLGKCRESRRRWREQALADYDHRYRFLKPMKRTIEEVAAGAVSSLDCTLTDIENWRRERDREAAHLFRVFNSAMPQMPAHALAPPPINPLSANSIEWDRGDRVANVVVNLIPGLNVLHQMTMRKIQRQRLEGILNDAMSPLITDVSRFVDCGDCRDLTLCCDSYTNCELKFLS